MNVVSPGIRAKVNPHRDFLLMALLLFVGACGRESIGPEQELRDWVARGEAAVEARDRRELLAMISPAYADARGNDRDRIGDILRAYFFRMNSIQLVMAVEEVTVIGNSAAEMRVTAGMAGGHDGVLGFSADAYRFVLELEKNGDEWELLSARWGALGDDLR